MTEHLGFIGTGNLGGPMVEILLKSGYRLTVFDTNPAVLAPLRDQGAAIAGSAREVADTAEIVFACLSSGDASQAVARQVAGGTAIKIYVEHSTIGVPAIEAIARDLHERGIAVLDTPVVGGAGGSAVAAGKIATISSGPKAAFARIEPILRRLTQNVFYVGEKQGLSQICKMVNNAIGIAGLTIACEAMVMGVKAGIDARTLLDVVNAGSGRNVATEDKFPRAILPRKFAGSPIEIGLKDIQLYVETMRDMGLPSLVGSNIAEIWQACAAEEPGRGYNSIVQFFERFAGVEVKG
jgi:3-hydroxyisobutyrate dehydrogenase